EHIRTLWPQCPPPAELGVLVSHHLVGPVEQLGSIFEGDSEQPSDQLQRKLAGHLRYEISLPGFGSTRHDKTSSLCQVRTHPIHRTRGEAPRHDLAHSGV